VKSGFYVILLRLFTSNFVDERESCTYTYLFAVVEVDLSYRWPPQSITNNCFLYISLRGKISSSAYQQDLNNDLPHFPPQQFGRFFRIFIHITLNILVPAVHSPQ
jgi:hypothetical protein